MVEEGRSGDPTATTEQVATNEGETRRAKARGHGEETGHGRRSPPPPSRQFVGSVGAEIPRRVKAHIHICGESSKRNASVRTI